MPARRVVVDGAAGVWHGVSAAGHLAARGVSVQLVTPGRAVGLAIPHESVGPLLTRLRAGGVEFRTLTAVTGVDGAIVRVADVVTDETADLEADVVVAKTPLV